ncbi:MAG: ethylbenzene dehydrogenase-related protein [Planctomycetota bacterium]
MKKPVIALIMLAAVVALGGLIAYGWTHRYGPTEGAQPEEFPHLTVPYRGESVTLEPAGLTADFWRDLPTLNVQLIHQVTQTPWAKGRTPQVTVQAFHDGRDIYFRMRWPDDVSNRRVGLKEFSDACAVMLSVEPGPPAQTIMMGFGGASNIWHWKASTDAEFWGQPVEKPAAYADHYYPFGEEEVEPIADPEPAGAVQDMIASRPGSLTPKERQPVQGRGAYADGRWTVVFKRALSTPATDREAQVSPGQHSAAFAVWDGDKGDRGARKSISDWVVLDVEEPLGARRRGGRLRRWLARLAAPRSPGLLMAGPLAVAGGAARGTEEEPRLIEITGKRFEYQPNEVTVQRGETVTLRLESLDVTHGLYLDGYGVQLKARPGVSDKATFTADTGGRFSFRCSETCGPFHPYMIGYLNVVPNNRFRIFGAATGGAFLVVAGACLVAVRRTRKRKAQ